MTPECLRGLAVQQDLAHHGEEGGGQGGAQGDSQEATHVCTVVAPPDPVAIVRGEEAHVDLGLTAAQHELKDELRQYFARLVEEVEGSQDEEPTYTHYIRRMGQDG